LLQLTSKQHDGDCPWVRCSFTGTPAKQTRKHDFGGRPLLSAIVSPSFANSRSFVYRLNQTMFFDNLPLEITCTKCGKQINETVNWLKAESRKCPFCGTLIDTTEFRRGIDEATNRTHEMLQSLQESLRSIKIKIKL
jgi:ribosomal protein S27E